MLFIIEGCDGTGKTAFAEKLAKVMNAKYVHFASDIATNGDALNIFTGIINASKTAHIVCDRFCYGQFVYQKTVDERVLTHADLESLEELMGEVGAKRILFEANPNVIRQRLAARGETLINGMDVEEVMQRFENITILRDFKNWTLLRGDK